MALHAIQADYTYRNLDVKTMIRLASDALGVA